MFFITNLDLASILGRTDFDLENFHSGDSLGSHSSGFADSKIHGFPNFQPGRGSGGGEGGPLT